MAQRNLLHKNKLEDFKDWLASDGWTICEPINGLEVMRASKPKKKKNSKGLYGKRYIIIYEKDNAKQHYSMLDKDVPIFYTYKKERGKEHGKSIDDN